jgi:hypothetical protein
MRAGTHQRTEAAPSEVASAKPDPSCTWLEYDQRGRILANTPRGADQRLPFIAFFIGVAKVDLWRKTALRYPHSIFMILL